MSSGALNTSVSMPEPDSGTGIHSLKSVDAIYDRYAYFDEKAVALGEWHGFLKGLLRREFADADWVEFYGRRMEATPSDEDDG